MEDHKEISYMRPAFSAFAIALLFSAFIQSCGASRAGISNQLAIADVSGVVVVKDTETPSTELKKYLNVEIGRASCRERVS